jgi:RNA polymerase sigma factor (sigma-70 family)
MQASTMSEWTARTDGELLFEFAGTGNETAFAELVNRHGAMVRNVCRRVLADQHEAEDVAQAVFLTMARKARSLGRQPSLGGWLHRVAWCLAMDTRKARERRNRHEEEAMRENVAPDPSKPGDEILEQVHAALAGLPERYCRPVVLFHLEGLSLAETAAKLSLNVSTAGNRLARAREMLRKKLVRRGVAVGSVGSLTTLLSAEAGAAVLPATFVSVTVKAAGLAAAGKLAAGVATGAVSANVAALTKGACNMLFWSSVKTAAMAVAASVVVAGTTVVVAQKAAEPMRNQAARASSGKNLVYVDDTRRVAVESSLATRIGNLLFYVDAGDQRRLICREHGEQGKTLWTVTLPTIVDRLEVADSHNYLLNVSPGGQLVDGKTGAVIVRGEKVLVEFWHYPLVDHPNRPSDEEIAAGRKTIGDKIGETLKAANVEVVQFLWGRDGKVWGCDGKEGANRSSYSAMVLLDCKGRRPEEALAAVPYRIAGIVFKDGAYARGLPVETELKWLVTAKKGQIPAPCAYYSRGGSAYADLQQSKLDVERFQTIPGVVAQVFPPSSGVAGGGWSAKLTPASGHTLLEVFLLTETGFLLVNSGQVAEAPTEARDFVRVTQDRFDLVRMEAAPVVVRARVKPYEKGAVGSVGPAMTRFSTLVVGEVIKNTSGQALAAGAEIALAHDQREPLPAGEFTAYLKTEILKLSGKEHVRYNFTGTAAEGSRYPGAGQGTSHHAAGQ